MDASDRASAYEERILRSLRRITRAIDLYSRQLAAQCGLTGPQLVCLRILARHQSIQPTVLAKETDLSPATITGILDRLDARKFISRSRSKKDRRVINVSLTEAGRKILESAPSSLQDRFARRLRELTDGDQGEIHVALDRVVRMMDAENIDVAPVLSSGPVDATANGVEEFLKTDEEP